MPLSPALPKATSGIFRLSLHQARICADDFDLRLAQPLVRMCDVLDP